MLYPVPFLSQRTFAPRIFSANSNHNEYNERNFTLDILYILKIHSLLIIYWVYFSVTLLFAYYFTLGLLFKGIEIHDGLSDLEVAVRTWATRIAVIPVVPATWLLQRGQLCESISSIVIHRYPARKPEKRKVVRPRAVTSPRTADVRWRLMWLHTWHRVWRPRGRSVLWLCNASGIGT